MSGPLTALTAAAVVGSGTVGGVFFAFSGFVMPALDRLPPARAAAAMQSINVLAVRPPLMIALFGTAALAVAVPVLSWRTGVGPTGLLVAAGAVYLAGTVGTTIAGNVPLNDQLAGTPATLADSATWSVWSRSWTGRNHVRTAAALAATITYIAALAQSAGDPPVSENSQAC